jgi:hypothetical protein
MEEKPPLLGEEEFIDAREACHRTEEFESLYANNVLFEANVWDLKMIFGELRSGQTGAPEIAQHTSIAIPWAVAKIACIYLAINIIGFEEKNGPGAIRLVPSMLQMLSLNERAKADPRIMTIFTALMSVGNPEIFSKPVVYEEPPDPEGTTDDPKRHIRPQEDEQSTP